jgi:MoaA/NifB/PqqE/SkfB family radical SAM enzyme
MWAEGHEIARRIRAWDAGETPGPYTLELYPTLRCNMNCVFCDTRYRDGQRPDALQPADLEAIVDDAAAMDVRRIMLLGGGEPLLAPGADAALMRRIKDSGIEGILSTNALLLGAEMAETLVEVGWDEVQVSLDAADPRVNDYLRGTPGALDRVARNLCRLSGLRRTAGGGRPRLLIHSVITSKNFRDLDRLVAFAASLGAWRINVDALIAYRAEQQALLLSDDERAELPEHVHRALAVATERGIEHNLEHLADPRATERGQMELPCDGPEDAHHAPCLNPWYYAVVDADGNISTCCVIVGTGHDVREKGFKATWEQGLYMSGLRDQMRHKKTPRRCRECSMAMISRNDEVRKILAGA